MEAEILKKLDKKIDDNIKNIKALSLPKDLALFHLLTCFEDYIRLPLLKNPFKDKEEYFNFIKYAQDGLHFAVLWVYKYCPNIYVKDFLIQEDNNNYIEANILLEKAIQYSQVWDTMNLLFRKKSKIIKEDDNKIYHKLNSELEQDFDLADRFMRLNKDSFSWEKALSGDIKKINNSLINVEKQDSGNSRIKYSLPDDIYNKIKDSINEAYKSRWELDESWDLGGYTIKQFRSLWVSLVALCFAHSRICFFSGVKSMAMNSVVKVLPRRRWENELSERSDLDKNIVKIILDDLIFDYSLFQTSNKKYPDITYQPFFPIRDNLLLVNNYLVLLSNPERNMWDLISIKRDSLHSKLRNKKERAWIESLTKKFKKYSLETCGPINYSFNGQDSDLDYLVFDRKKRFGIGFQLKWLTEPDRIKDVHYFDNQIIEGQNQAKLSLEWLNSKDKLLLQKMNISKEELEKYNFTGMVLSKNLIGSGVVHQGEIPVGNEFLLDCILGDPHNKDLKTFWTVVEKHLYLPEINKHYENEDFECEFGKIKFIGKNAGAVIKKNWTAKDINLKGL